MQNRQRCAQPQLIFHYCLVSLLASEVIGIVVGNVRALLVVFKFNEFQQHHSSDSFFYSDGRLLRSPTMVGRPEDGVVCSGTKSPVASTSSSSIHSASSDRPAKKKYRQPEH